MILKRIVGKWDGRRMELDQSSHRLLRFGISVIEFQVLLLESELSTI
jgi:hypothetical protein